METAMNNTNNTMTRRGMELLDVLLFPFNSLKICCTLDTVFKTCVGNNSTFPFLRTFWIFQQCIIIPPFMRFFE